ncbi:hypothetical protein QA612_19545 [Evansella sp. AB-P1]|uniref:hypothetical protein n=1 Tax=Evansella sp. AB-P1 TaxID=3037653 RepID=UPI00241EBE30|nr:hypothetical protein [Evansella sp. AB-P1]MDG5789655.1 hypothetical protein [Evansella sp. AB-P1]
MAIKYHSKEVIEVTTGVKKSNITVIEVNKPNLRKWAEILLQMEQNGTLLK